LKIENDKWKMAASKLTLPAHSRSKTRPADSPSRLAASDSDFKLEISVCFHSEAVVSRTSCLRLAAVRCADGTPNTRDKR
jgi:hypothetical protein